MLLTICMWVQGIVVDCQSLEFPNLSFGLMYIFSKLCCQNINDRNEQLPLFTTDRNTVVPRFPDFRKSKHQKACFNSRTTRYPDYSISGLFLSWYQVMPTYIHSCFKTGYRNMLLYPKTQNPDSLEIWKSSLSQYPEEPGFDSQVLRICLPHPRWMS